MRDTVIVGGGLCGLMLARHLHEQGRDCVLYEARLRLGGRILSRGRADRVGEQRVDLGPSWYWPGHQPRISRLVAELGLPSHAQHDSGDELTLNDPDKSPEISPGSSVHGDARCLANGMASLIDRLAADLPADSLHLGHILVGLSDCGDHVQLEFNDCGKSITVTACHVVLAIPPRLLAERVAFAPALSPLLAESLQAVPTWMAAQAKAVMRFDSPFWRNEGRSGNAFVGHEQAVLGEVYDACSPEGTVALGGFLALPSALRKEFSVGLPLLIESQLVQLFGQDAAWGELEYMDWADEPWTCSELDRRQHAEPDYLRNVLLQHPHWHGKLFFGASESAASGSGYMEGALQAAARIGKQLLALSMETPAEANPADPLAAFQAWAASQPQQAFEHYKQHLHVCLSRQQRQQLTRHALQEAVDQVYLEALLRLDMIDLPVSNTAPAQQAAALLAPFKGFNKGLLEQALAFNRESCALSNFPADHQPGADYVNEIVQVLGQAWKGFSIGVDHWLRARQLTERHALETCP